MSKSLRNYPDVNEVFDRDGSGNAMRWFLASPFMSGNLIVTVAPRRCPPGAATAVERLRHAGLYAPEIGTWRTDSAPCWTDTSWRSWPNCGMR